MKRLEALDKATEIARLIDDGVYKLMYHTPMKDAPLLAMLPLIKLGADAKEGKTLDINILNFRVFEILIYGSVTNENQGEVGDIDIMVLDSGSYSTFFQCKHVEDDWYEELAENLYLFLTGWLGYKEDAIKSLLRGFKTDLHVLPMELLKSKTVRAEIANRHSDSHFFQNAFSSMLRYDKSAKEFVPTDISYLETKYGTDLSELRTS